MAGSMPAASEAEEVSTEVRVLPGEEGVVMPIDQGSLEEMKTGSYKFAANVSGVDAKKRQMTLTVYGYDAYRAEDVDALDVGSVFSSSGCPTASSNLPAPRAAFSAPIWTALWKHRT